MPPPPRITGGVARGVPLAAVRGIRLRPTAARVREALFNVLGGAVEEVRLLDLYAGTGIVGLEALSRGAGEVVFIERERVACEAIAQSLGRLEYGEAGTVIRGRLPQALTAAAAPFGLIFLDPPYGDDDAEVTLVEAAALLGEDGTVVYEHSSRYNPPERPAGLRRRETRTYGDSALTFFEQEG